MRLKLAIFTVLVATFLGSTMASVAEEPSEQVKRMDAAATVLDEIMGTPDKGIPEELLDSAKCVAVIPSVIKIGVSPLPGPLNRLISWRKSAKREF